MKNIGFLRKEHLGHLQKVGCPTKKRESCDSALKDYPPKRKITWVGKRKGKFPLWKDALMGTNALTQWSRLLDWR